MGEMPAAAAASVAVELLSPVTVDVIMVVWEASLPLTAAEALSRTESALAPVVGEGEAEARACWQYWVPKAMTVAASSAPQASLAQSRTP